MEARRRDKEKNVFVPAEVENEISGTTTIF